MVCGGVGVERETVSNQGFVVSNPRQAGHTPPSPTSLERRWREDLGPRVAARLEDDPEMKCGHTCGTCPTKATCQLHDALDAGAVRDIEDL